MTNNERIDAYFNSDLSEVEKQNLLNDLDSNPGLKEEFEFQQEVVNGIKAYRKQELIAKLDNIQIVSTGQALLIKTIAVIGIVGAGTVGTILWMDNNDIPEETNVIKTEEVTTQPEEIPVESISPETETAIVENIEETDTPVDKAENPESISKEVESNIPEVAIPEFNEPEVDTTVKTDEDLVAPDAVNTSDLVLSSQTDVDIIISKKYNFHYQAKDGKLLLYGDFNDSPFEIIEIKTNIGINTYLFYKENFFELKQDNEEIRPLEVVENKELIKELQKRR